MYTYAYGYVALLWIYNSHFERKRYSGKVLEGPVFALFIDDFFRYEELCIMPVNIKIRIA